MFALTVIDTWQLRYSIADKGKVHPICGIRNTHMLANQHDVIETGLTNVWGKMGEYIVRMWCAVVPTLHRWSTWIPYVALCSSVSTHIRLQIHIHIASTYRHVDVDTHCMRAQLHWNPNIAGEHSQCVSMEKYVPQSLFTWQSQTWLHTYATITISNTLPPLTHLWQPYYMADPWDPPPLYLVPLHINIHTQTHTMYTYLDRECECNPERYVKESAVEGDWVIVSEETSTSTLAPCRHSMW